MLDVVFIGEDEQVDVRAGVEFPAAIASESQQGAGMGLVDQLRAKVNQKPVEGEAEAAGEGQTFDPLVESRVESGKPAAVQGFQCGLKARGFRGARCCDR